MKKLLASVLSICMISIGVPVYANCPAPEEPVISEENPLRLKKDRLYRLSQDGWFFTDSQELEIRIRLVDADFLEKELQLVKQKVGHYKILYESQQQISEKYQTAWLESDKHLTEVLKRESRTKLWYFIGGILITVGAGLALGFSAKAVR